MKLPTVDVILLSWNRAEMTLETVFNLLEQTGVNLEIWIVDQGSRPEELDLLKRSLNPYSNVHITELQKNVGVPAGRNVGTRLGHAEYTVSIDNDAIFESSDALKRVVELFNEDAAIGVISFRIKNFYTHQDDELSWVYPKAMKSLKDQRFFTTRFVGCGHAIRRSVFEQANGYDDELFFFWEEVDFSYRVINLGYRLIYTPEIRVLHKVAPEARVRWQDKRFYYLVRNAIYINYKYKRSALKAAIVALGYFVKGCFNKLPQQTISGVIDAIKMIRKLPPQYSHQPQSMTKTAQTYLWENELRYRGSLWNRLKTEVFVDLPARE